MGNSNGHHSKKRSIFNESEKHDISAIFHKLSSRKQSVSVGAERSIKQFHKENLQMLAGKLITSELNARIYNMMKKCPPQNHANSSGVTNDMFEWSMAVLLKGSIDHKASVLCHMISGGQDNFKLCELGTFSEEVIKSYCKLVSEASGILNNWKILNLDRSSITRFSEHIIHDMATYDGKQRGDYKSMPFSETQLEKWLYQNTLYQQMLNHLFHHCFPLTKNEPIHLLMPICKPCMNWTSNLLDISSILTLNDALPQPLRNTWRPLYSLHIHGESFATMLRFITDKGPTIIIIKDKKGNVFGGFNSHSWKISPQFYGSLQCFLFKLQPSLNIYHSTNYNDNFVYLNQNQETLPNGLGFGGQFNYFGLFLDSNFGKGMCSAKPLCTTYACPQLSAQNIGEDGQDGRFEIEALEVFGVGEEILANKDSEHPTSILDNNCEAKAMLEMIGKGTRSEGMREPDPMADNMEEDQ